MNVKIPKDLIKQLENLRKINFKSVRNQILEAIMQYIIIEKETQKTIKSIEI